jgi:RNA polymerase sigma-70 factor (ECF subfamily)
MSMSEETFSALLAPNLDAMRGFVRRRLRTLDYADDIVQQTLLRAFKHRHQLRVHSKFKSWLWSIAANEVRLFQRSSRPVLSLDECQGLQFAAHDRSPSAEYERVERERTVHTALARLGERDRLTIQLCDLNELGLREVAAVLALSIAGAKTARFRARQRLARALAGAQSRRRSSL